MDGKWARSSTLPKLKSRGHAAASSAAQDYSAVALSRKLCTAVVHSLSNARPKMNTGTTKLEASGIRQTQCRDSGVSQRYAAASPRVEIHDQASTTAPTRRASRIEGKVVSPEFSVRASVKIAGASNT